MPPRFIDQTTLDAREDEILDAALALIASQGLVALTMDKVVAQVSYSKGTVYNHFNSKEDLFVGLCNRNMRRLSSLFVRASAITASARDRMSAIGFAYMLSVLQYPQHFALVMNAKTEMFDKASQARRDEHQRIDDQLFDVICTIIQDAINRQELSLPAKVDAKQVSFSLWAMSFGTIGLLLNGEKACSTMTGMMLEDRVMTHGHLVMDGLGWVPSQQSDDELLAHLKNHVFSEEVAELKRQGICLL